MSATGAGTGAGAGANLARVGVHNRAVVLDVVRRSGPVSRAAISQRTGLSAQTVTNIAARLLDDGLLREAGSVSGARGAPGRVLELVPRGRVAVGVHLDPAELRVVVVDLAGTIVAAERTDAVHVDDPAEALAAIVRLVEHVLARIRVARARVLGVGVAVPGPIDPGGTRVESPVQLRAWVDVPIADELQAALGLPVRLEKDGVASAIGETWSAGTADDLVSVYLGQGVGAAVVVGGEVVRGSTGNAGEFGGMPVHAHGAWTELWDACQPLQQVRRAIAAGIVPGPVDAEDAVAVRSAYERLCADPAGAPLVAEAGSALGSALAHVVELLDVPAVVVGGGAALSGGATLLDALAHRLAARLPRGPVVAVRFTASGRDAVARGAGCAVLRAALAPSGTGLRAPARVAGPGPGSVWRLGAGPARASRP